MRKIAFPALALAAVGGGLAWAAIPGSDGVIHGCYSPVSNPPHPLYVIDPSQQETCGSMTALNWNQSGPAGPAGPAGPEGPAGPAGSGAATLPGAIDVELGQTAGRRNVPQEGGPRRFQSRVVALPRGSWFLHARLNTRTHPARAAIRCDLIFDAVSQDSHVRNLYGDDRARAGAQIVLNALVTSRGPGAGPFGTDAGLTSVRCVRQEPRRGADDAISVFRVQLSAVPVAAIDTETRPR